MADNSIDAVDLLRVNDRGRIEIACIEHVCKVDIKK
jgi:flavin-binding protein dodecin